MERESRSFFDFSGKKNSNFGGHSKLQSLAYRLLGSLSDAEDAVQDTYLRWYKLSKNEREKVLYPVAWCRTVLVRICLDKLKSAQSRREIYIGEWLPEPLPDDESWAAVGEFSDRSDPADRLALSNSVSMALMVVLDKMTPAERVSFILHDVFQYSFDEVSEIVGRTSHACRQLASSARKRIDKNGIFTTSPEEHSRLNAAFQIAWCTGNISELVSVLDENVCAITDGGGHVSASIEPLCGQNDVIEFFVSCFERQSDLVIEEAIVNGEPGLIGKVDNCKVSIISTSIKNGCINNIWVVRNPEKLTNWH